MYPHEDEEKGVPVSFVYETDVTVGDFSVTNLVVYAQYGGVKVTKVPAGANFEIHANYTVQNANPSTLTPIWSTSMTVWNETDNKIAGLTLDTSSDNYGYHTGGGAKSASDAINAVMPAKATIFRVKIHCNQATNAGAPPTSAW